MEFDENASQPLKRQIERTMANSNLDLNAKQELKDYLREMEQHASKQKTLEQWKKLQNQVLQGGSKCMLHIKQNTYQLKRAHLMAAMPKRRKGGHCGRSNRGHAAVWIGFKDSGPVCTLRRSKGPMQLLNHIDFASEAP